MGKRDGSRGMGKRELFVGFLTGVWLSLLGGCPYLLLKAPEVGINLQGAWHVVAKHNVVRGMPRVLKTTFFPMFQQYACFHTCTQRVLPLLGEKELVFE